MSYFDEIGEDLTDMMIILDKPHYSAWSKELVQALGKAHAQACKAARAMRHEQEMARQMEPRRARA